MKKIKRSRFTLLEVMIAIALLLICFYPLIYPHTILLKEQKAFIDRVELDHFMNNFYGEVLEDLYLNRYEFGDLLNGVVFPVEKEISPYKGEYWFEVENFKPKNGQEEDEQPQFYVYLFKVTFLFTHLDNSSSQEYQYLITVVKNAET